MTTPGDEPGRVRPFHLFDVRCTLLDYSKRYHRLLIYGLCKQSYFVQALYFKSDMNHQVDHNFVVDPLTIHEEPMTKAKAKMMKEALTYFLKGI